MNDDMIFNRQGYMTNENVSKYMTKNKIIKQLSFDTNDFYNKYPSFDWNFYIKYYPDLQNDGIVDEATAIYHYITHGKLEKRRISNILLHDYCSEINIEFNIFLKMCRQIYVSESLESFKSRIYKKYNLCDMCDLTQPSFFFGVYNDTDLKIIHNMQNLRIIIWGGEDANFDLPHSTQTLKEIKKLKNCIHLAISDCIHERLAKKCIQSTRVNFSLIDSSIFRTSIPTNDLGNCIFIFNGQIEGREHVYGDEIYENVIKQRPHFEYIFSNKINVAHENMIHVYKKCFVMLRLTSTDGNANSVQECEILRIPVIHNQSKYGLKWNSAENVVQHIDNLFDKKIIEKYKQNNKLT